MNKNYISAIKLGVSVCGGAAFKDCVKYVLKANNASNGLITTIGRLGLELGGFVMGANMTMTGIEFVEEIASAYKKKADNASDSVEIVEEDPDTDDSKEESDGSIE